MVFISVQKRWRSFMYLESHGKHFKTRTDSTTNTFKFLSSRKTFAYISGQGSAHLHMLREMLRMKETHLSQVPPHVLEQKPAAVCWFVCSSHGTPHKTISSDIELLLFRLSFALLCQFKSISCSILGLLRQRFRLLLLGNNVE